MRLAENLNISQQHWAARQWRVQLAEYLTFIALYRTLPYYIEPFNQGIAGMRILCRSVCVGNVMILLLYSKHTR